MALCSECTYLGTCYDDGTFWCEAKLECVYAHEQECYRFCRAYGRPSSVSDSYARYSKDKTSGGRCYLTTIMCNILKMSDDNPFLNSMRSLRNDVMQKDEKYKSLLVEYDIVGPVIADNLSKDPLKYQIAANGFFKYIKPISNLIREKKYDEAIASYIEMTNSLKMFYNINIAIEIDAINNADINNSGHGIYKVKKITY